MKKNRTPKAHAQPLAEVIQLFPERSKAVTEARKTERKKRALAKGGISRWTFSDPDHDSAILCDIRACIHELESDSLRGPLQALCTQLMGKTLFGGEL